MGLMGIGMYHEYSRLDSNIKALELGNYLEFGCGDGGFLQFVLERNPSFTTVTAVDINPQAIELAKRALKNFDINFMVQEQLPLDIEDEYFSTITLSNTLHHLQDKSSVIDELKRLIHPGGYIIITEMISDGLSRAEESYYLYHCLRAEIDRMHGIFHDITYTSDEIARMIEATGLEIVESELLLNEKAVNIEEDEIRRMAKLIDDFVQRENGSPEIGELTRQVAGIKENLKRYGIRRPRQLYLKTRI